MAKKGQPDLDAIDKAMARPKRTAREEHLRDTFAAAALAGHCARLRKVEGGEWPSKAELARAAYEQADAMLAERKR